MAFVTLQDTDKMNVLLNCTWHFEDKWSFSGFAKYVLHLAVIVVEVELISLSHYSR